MADLVAGMVESSDSSETVTVVLRMEMAAVVVVVVVVVQMFASISVLKPHRQTVEGGAEGVGQELRHGLHVGPCPRAFLVSHWVGTFIIIIIIIIIIIKVLIKQDPNT